MSEPSDRRVPRGLGPEHEAPPDVIPTLAEHAEAVQLDPMAGVPLRGWLRLLWAAHKAGWREAWARLRHYLQGHGL